MLPPDRPLEGLVVLDLTRVLAGPYATQMMGELGAEVWKVERPGSGDETRAWGPPFIGDTSAYFLSVNREKRSAALDFRNPADLDALRAAARVADVVIENYIPGDLARYGLDAASLRRERPELIVCSISGYGQDGPYASLAGYDAVMQGFVGLQSITGEPDRAPVKVGVAVIDVLTGVHAAAAILAALVGRLRGGSGTHLDVAMFEVGVASLVNVSHAALATGQPARRHGHGHPTIVPYQTFEAADGAFVLGVGNDEQWRKACDAIGLPALARDARLGANRDRVLHRTEVVDALARHFAGESRAVWLERLRAARIPAGPVREVHEVVRDPALVERDFVRNGGAPGFALPWTIGGVRPGRRLDPPALGAHTDAFRARFGA
jgi:crotonobetainyl-CoA:carnitine CoA-transferase CaiB-like acyl-CoA transferase